MFTKILLLILQVLTTLDSKCTNESPPMNPKYYLIEKCHRSTLSVLIRANLTSLNSCQKLGIEKKGLALNFSPKEALDHLQRNESIEFTCEVLKCTESDGGLSLVNDTRYDYYSIFAKNLPDVNSTCVPAIGMVTLLSTMNYTDAEALCKNKTGKLADIMSETRTDALAQVLVGSGADAAYVGVKSDNGSDFVGVNGDSFDCTTYRAWAPGHPKRRKQKYGCLAITRGRTWMTVQCKKKMPALCELIPSGPYGKRGRIFASRRLNNSETEPSP